MRITSIDKIIDILKEAAVNELKTNHNVSFVSLSEIGIRPYGGSWSYPNKKVLSDIETYLTAHDVCDIDANVTFADIVTPNSDYDSMGYRKSLYSTLTLTIYKETSQSFDIEIDWHRSMTIDNDARRVYREILSRINNSLFREKVTNVINRLQLDAKEQSMIYTHKALEDGMWIESLRSKLHRYIVVKRNYDINIEKFIKDLYDDIEPWIYIGRPRKHVFEIRTLDDILFNTKLYRRGDYSYAIELTMRKYDPLTSQPFTKKDITRIISANKDRFKQTIRDTWYGHKFTNSTSINLFKMSDCVITNENIVVCTLTLKDKVVEVLGEN